jgi:Uncharacterized conserved protein
MGENTQPFEGESRQVRFCLRGRLASIIRGEAQAPLRFRADQSLRHLAESIGIPACEIGSAFSDGEAWPLELPPPDGSKVELFPRAEPLDFPGEPSFLVDGQLGRLARELRLLGFDSLWRGAMDRDELIDTAIAEERALITRDRSLLIRRELAAIAGERRDMLVLARKTYDQLVEICRRFGLARLMRPLSLCSSCGARLGPVEKSEVAARVPKIVAEKYEDFRLCPSCGKVFWRGDHARSIDPLLERLGAEAGLQGRPEEGPPFAFTSSPRGRP